MYNRLKEKQIYHTYAQGITGLRSSYLALQNTPHRLISGLPVVFLQNFSLGRLEFLYLIIFFTHLEWNPHSIYFLVAVVSWGKCC